MLNMLRPALALLAVFTVLTGLVYPLAVTGLAQILFPVQANGSIITREGRPAGSALLGQPFDDPRYFWGRPSATTPFPYNAAASSGSNLGQGNPALRERVQARVAFLRAADPANAQPIPLDLVTASASGLDPHISPAAADYRGAGGKSPWARCSRRSCPRCHPHRRKNVRHPRRAAGQRPAIESGVG
jgi:K+-transporting ATPase ATPase C chain